MKQHVDIVANLHLTEIGETTFSARLDHPLRRAEMSKMKQIRFSGRKLQLFKLLVQGVPKKCWQDYSNLKQIGGFTM